MSEEYKHSTNFFLSPCYQAQTCRITFNSIQRWSALAPCQEQSPFRPQYKPEKTSLLEWPVIFPNQYKWSIMLWGRLPLHCTCTLKFCDGPTKTADPSSLLSSSICCWTDTLLFTAAHTAVQPRWPVVLSSLEARQHGPGFGREVAAMYTKTAVSSLTL